MNPIQVLMTLRFSEAQLNRIRDVSPQLNVIQKSVPEGHDGLDVGELLTGEEEILYGFMPPRDLSRAPKLKWVQLHSAGINHLINSNHPILRSGILITTASGIHAVPIGEFAIALMLALARKIPLMTRKQERAEWPRNKWNLFLGTELRGKTLGIVGYGSIGRHAARIAKNGFGMRILALSRSGRRRDFGYCEPGVGDPEGILPDEWFALAQLNDLLAQSDFVLIATPLTDATRNLIGENELRTMKPTAFLVNIARGGIVNESALIRALKERWIAGAGLDVFEHEPLPSDSELWQLDNAIIAPHVSAATPHYDDRATDLFCENLRRYLRGEALLNEVDRGRGY